MRIDSGSGSSTRRPNNSPLAYPAVGPVPARGWRHPTDLRRRHRPRRQYFVVTSGSGGDRPPISDTAMAFPIAGGDFVEPLWVARCFDSVYSVAITEEAVYVGGHFNWNESPTANQPWPGLDNVGYGTGQGLSGYGLGDQVVRRDHIGALDPATGTALQWNPGSDSFEGNKAMEATPQGLFVGGDGNTQGGINTGRVAFYDFITVPAPTKPDTTITAPIEGRVVPAGTQFSIQGKAKVPAGTDVQRVQVEVQQRGTSNYLQDDLTTWGGTNTINATLGALANGTRPWSLILTLTGTRNNRAESQDRSRLTAPQTPRRRSRRWRSSTSKTRHRPPPSTAPGARKRRRRSP